MYLKIWLKYFEAVLKETRRNSYGFDAVKCADITEGNGSVENAPKKK